MTSARSHVSPRCRRWSESEDDVLRMLVSQHGAVRGSASEYHWSNISKHLPGRTNKDCRKRWYHSLDPTLRKGGWTADEDRIISSTYENIGPAWKIIEGRRDDQVAKRYKEVLAPEVSNRLSAWTTEEDQYLTEKVAKIGRQWAAISAGLQGRPPLTCRNRWRSIDRGLAKQKYANIFDDFNSVLDTSSSADSRTPETTTNEEIAALIDTCHTFDNLSWENTTPFYLETAKESARQDNTYFEFPMDDSQMRYTNSAEKNSISDISHENISLLKSNQQTSLANLPDPFGAVADEFTTFQLQTETPSIDCNGGNGSIWNHHHHHHHHYHHHHHHYHYA